MRTMTWSRQVMGLQQSLQTCSSRYAFKARCHVFVLFLKVLRQGRHRVGSGL